VEFMWCYHRLTTKQDDVLREVWGCLKLLFINSNPRHCWSCDLHDSHHEGELYASCIIKEAWVYFHFMLLYVTLNIVGKGIIIYFRLKLFKSWADYFGEACGSFSSWGTGSVPVGFCDTETFSSSPIKQTLDRRTTMFVYLQHDPSQVKICKHLLSDQLCVVIRWEQNRETV